MANGYRSRAGSGRPVLALKFLLQATCGPGVFLAYLALLDGPGFHDLGGNLRTIDLRLFLPFALAGHAAWLLLPWPLFRWLRPGLALPRFLAGRLTWWGLLPAAFGALNLSQWISGMEGNIFGFLFFLPLLLLACLDAALFLAQMALLFRRVPRAG